MPVQQSSLLHSIRPLIIVCQLTAYALFSINYITWQAEVKKVNIFTIILSISMSICLHIIYWSSYFGFDQHGTEIAKNILPKLVYINVILYSIIKIWIFFNRQKIVKFLKQIHVIDEKFKELNVNFDYKSDRKNIIKVLIGAFALIFVTIILGLCVQVGFMIDIDSALSLLNLFSFIGGTMMTFQIISAMIGIRRRYEAANYFLEMTSERKATDIKILTEIHLLATESIEIFNSIYGPPIMLFITIGFGWLCIFIFMTLMVSSVMWTDFIFVSLYSIFVNLIMVAVITSIFYYAEWTKKQGRRTVVLLYKLTNKVDCELTAVKIQSFIGQLSDIKIEFSCGLVDFNWKFYFKYVTTAIMYFIILVQFESSSAKSKCPETRIMEN